MNALEGRARAVLVRELRLEPGQRIEQNTRLVDLGLDSFSKLSLLCALEEDLGVTISDEEFDRLQTVGDLERAVRPAGQEAM